MMAAEEEYYIYTGREAVPRHVTRVRIHKSISVIPARAFYQHPNITELYCHGGVKKVAESAFYNCPSLRQVIMPGVEEVEAWAFFGCDALTDVECGKLEIIGEFAFGNCKSLRSTNLPSVKIVQGGAFIQCKALTNVKFGNKLEEIGEGAFMNCRLERITIPLKDNMITNDNIFKGCGNLKHVDLVEGVVLSATIAVLLLEEWRNDMNEEIDAINQILPNTPAGGIGAGVGGKAQAIRTWITNVLRNIIEYKAEHQSYLNEAATTLQLALPSDIVIKSVLPFLELPSYTFE